VKPLFLFSFGTSESVISCGNAQRPADVTGPAQVLLRGLVS